MGQTLPNGIYLPAEGERNCYDGLEGNWRSLDSLISTVAGKASATHTHGNITNDGKVGTTANLPLITGTSGTITTGSFGTSANTFCEGNDSRLSDARTPVAHTHTKSDVTDLLNSNFIPSANNTYDLGSSLYQWNNAYIKSLTINGVACGDILTHNASEFVGVTGAQTIEGDKTFTSTPRVIRTNDPFYYLFSTGYVKGSNPASNMYSGIRFHCNPDAAVSNKITGGLDMVYYASGYNAIGLNVRNYDENSNQRSFTVSLRVSSNSTLLPDLVPSVSEQINLGSSTAQWKDCYTRAINGINPGALSLPDLNNGIDISSYITHLDKVVNNYTPSANGWLSIRVKKTSLVHASLMIYQTGGLLSSCETDEFNISGTNLPVIANQNVEIYIYADVLASAKFYPCQGNI